MKRVMVEGPEAKGKFERTMKRLFQVSKHEIKESERKDRDRRKQKD